MSVYSAIKSHWLYLHAVATGCFGFLATIVGAHFFKMSEPIWYICLGVAVYLLTNQVMLKFQFNSYQANGATVTTTLVFVTQAVCIAGWTVGSISSKWLLGVACIIAGTYLLKTSTEEQHHSTCKEEDNCNNSKSQ